LQLTFVPFRISLESPRFLPREKLPGVGSEYREPISSKLDGKSCFLKPSYFFVNFMFLCLSAFSPNSSSRRSFLPRNSTNVISRNNNNNNNKKKKKNNIYKFITFSEITAARLRYRTLRWQLEREFLDELRRAASANVNLTVERVTTTGEGGGRGELSCDRQADARRSRTKANVPRARASAAVLRRFFAAHGTALAVPFPRTQFSCTGEGEQPSLSLSLSLSLDLKIPSRASEREGDDARLDGRGNDRSRGEGKESALVNSRKTSVRARRSGGLSRRPRGSHALLAP